MGIKSTFFLFSLTLLIQWELPALVFANQSAPSQQPVASIPEPQPPAENPHPAVTPLDKKRVAFAEKTIELLLKKPWPVSPSDASGKIDQDKTNKSLDCLASVACFGKDKAFLNELIAIQKNDGLVTEFRHVHIIPWSMDQYLNLNGAKIAATQDTMKGPQVKPDEYMIHVYVKMNKTEGWYHLDIILTENQKEEIFLRSFFLTPMGYDGVKLPPGTVC